MSNNDQLIFDITHLILKNLQENDPEGFRKILESESDFRRYRRTLEVGSYDKFNLYDRTTHRELLKHCRNVRNEVVNRTFMNHELYEWLRESGVRDYHIFTDAQNYITPNFSSTLSLFIEFKNKRDAMFFKLGWHHV